MKLNNVLLIISFILLTLSSCQKEEPSKPKEPKVETQKITLSTNDLSVEEGGELELKILKGKYPFTVTVADKTVAEVSIEKVVITIKGLSEGKTTLSIAGKDGTTEQVAITVLKKATVVESVYVAKGEDFYVRSRILGTNFPYVASGIDETIATVRVQPDWFGEGVYVYVTGVKEGETAFTIKDSKDAIHSYKVVVSSTEREAFLANPTLRGIDRSGTVRIFDGKAYVPFVDRGEGAFWHPDDSNLTKIGAKYLNKDADECSIYFAWEGDFSKGKKKKAVYHDEFIYSISRTLAKLEIVKIENGIIWIEAEEKDKHDGKIYFFKMVAKLPKGE